MRREPFGFASAETPEAPTDLAPAFEPVVLASDGVSIEFSRRDDPEVNILPADHLLCVNFRTMHGSVYAYAGGRAVRGTRHFGSAHLIAADHPIRAHTPDATDHVVVRLAPSRLASRSAPPASATFFPTSK